MKPDEIKAAIRRRPFRPCRLTTLRHEQIFLPDEFAAGCTNDGYTVVVFGHHGTIVVINAAQIISIRDDGWELKHAE